MFRRVGLVLTLAVAAGCSRSEVKERRSGSTGSPKAPSFSLIALAELRGQVGPCGCTSDPLGDISRTAQLIEAARAAGPTLVVDAGSVLYSKSPVPTHLTTQEELKADLLVTTYAEQLHVAAVGLGPADLAQGAAKLRLPRHVVNLGPGQTIPSAPPAVLDVGGTKVGVFGVVADGALPGVALTPPVAAAQGAIRTLRAQGAQIVVGLVQASSKKDAVKLVRDIGGIDIAVAGLGAAAPEPDEVEVEATRVGDGWLVIPGNRGQVLSRLDITVRGPGPLADAIGMAAAAAKTAALGRRLAALDADLARFAADKTADLSFVQRKQQERAALAQDSATLTRTPLAVPAAGSYFTLDQVRIGKQLACDVAVQDRVTAFFGAAGEANVAAAAAIPVPPPPTGQAAYVGSEACSDCHADATEFWATTRHAQAWETLEQRGQQFDFDCIGCHVTGWNQAGGSNLGFNAPLRDVQCETCHGPGSIHVAQGGEDKPPTVWRAPPATMCATQCHTAEHSDTFELQAYLRDVVGPGHGAQLRETLGDGPTGGQLRKAALDKAGRTLGAGCIR